MGQTWAKQYNGFIINSKSPFFLGHPVYIFIYIESKKSSLSHLLLQICFMHTIKHVRTHQAYRQLNHNNNILIDNNCQVGLK